MSCSFPRTFTLPPELTSVIINHLDCFHSLLNVTRLNRALLSFRRQKWFREKMKTFKALEFLNRSTFVIGKEGSGRTFMVKTIVKQLLPLISEVFIFCNVDRAQKLVCEYNWLYKVSGLKVNIFYEGNYSGFLGAVDVGGGQCGKIPPTLVIIDEAGCYIIRERFFKRDNTTFFIVQQYHQGETMADYTSCIDQVLLLQLTCRNELSLNGVFEWYRHWLGFNLLKATIGTIQDDPQHDIFLSHRGLCGWDFVGQIRDRTCRRKAAGVFIKKEDTDQMPMLRAADLSCSKDCPLCAA